jgi:hypothetical protein
MTITQATDTIGADQRRELCAATVTLDGKPARITGRRGVLATVAGGGLAVELAWPAVAAIVEQGGEFTS